MIELKTRPKIVSIKTELKIERLLFKACLNLPTKLNAFIVECSSINDRNFSKFLLKKQKLMKNKDVLDIIDFLTKRLELKDSQKRQFVFNFINENYLSKECTNKDILIEQLFLDCPILAKLTFMWNFVDSYTLNSFSMPLSDFEDKLMRYLCTSGSLEDACKKYNLSKMHQYNLVQSIKLKSGKNDLKEAIRMYLTTSYLKLETLKVGLLLENMRCHKMFDKIIHKNPNDFSYKVILEGALELEYYKKGEEDEKEKDIYIKSTILKYNKILRDDFLDILTGKKELSRKEIIARYFEKILALKYYNF